MPGWGKFAGSATTLIIKLGGLTAGLTVLSHIGIGDSSQNFWRFERLSSVNSSSTMGLAAPKR